MQNEDEEYIENQTIIKVCLNDRGQKHKIFEEAIQDVLNTS